MDQESINPPGNDSEIPSNANDLISALENCTDGQRIKVLELLGRNDDDIVKNSTWDNYRLALAFSGAGWDKTRIIFTISIAYGFHTAVETAKHKLGFSFSDALETWLKYRMSMDNLLELLQSYNPTHEDLIPYFNYEVKKQWFAHLTPEYLYKKLMDGHWRPRYGVEILTGLCLYTIESGIDIDNVLTFFAKQMPEQYRGEFVKAMKQKGVTVILNDDPEPEQKSAPRQKRVGLWKRLTGGRP